MSKSERKTEVENKIKETREKVQTQKQAVKERRTGSGKNVSPISLELLVTIVDKKKSEFYADLLQSYEVNFQFIKAGMGTYRSSVLEDLGLADNEKRVIFSVVRSDRLDEIEEVLEEKFRSIKGGKGIAFTVPFSSLVSLSAFGFLSNNSDILKEAAEQ